MQNQYANLPTHLQNQLAALPPIRPVRGRRRHNVVASVQLVPPVPPVNGNGPAVVAPMHLVLFAPEGLPVNVNGPAVPEGLPVDVPIAAAPIEVHVPAVPIVLPAVAQPAVAIRNLPAGYLPVVETQARFRKFDLKNMDVECPKCGALHWACERLNKSTIARPIFGTCCLDGKVKIPKLLKPPRELLELYNGTNFHSKHFLAHITSYNNAFGMVSLSHNPVHLPGSPQSFTMIR